MKPVMVPTTDVNSETAIVTAGASPTVRRYRPGSSWPRSRRARRCWTSWPRTRATCCGAPRRARRYRSLKPLAYLFPTRRGASKSTPPGWRRRPCRPRRRHPTACVRRHPRRARAAELGVDLASLATGELVTVKMVEAAAGNGASAPPPELPLPLDAPSGVERVAVIGAGLGATQVIDIFAPGPYRPNAPRRRQQAVAVVDDDRAPVGGTGGRGSRRRRQRSSLEELFAERPFRLRRDRDRHLGIRPGPGFGSCAATSASRSPTPSIRPPGSAPAWSSGPGTSSAPTAISASARASGTTTSCPRYNSFDHHNVLGTDITTGPGCMTSGLVRIGDRVRLGTGIFVEPHWRSETARRWRREP